MGSEMCIRDRREGHQSTQSNPQQERRELAPAPPSFLTKAQWERFRGRNSPERIASVVEVILFVNPTCNSQRCCYYQVYVFLIDIQKMFLSIELELKSDRDMLRFVWGLPRQQIKHYRMKIVTFGLISSPWHVPVLKTQPKFNPGRICSPLRSSLPTATWMTSPPVPFQ